MRIIHEGDAGEAVRDIQRRILALGHRIEPEELEGRYGPSTGAAVREFQRTRGLPADGLVGPDTWGQLVEAGYRLGDRTLYLRSPAFRGDDVRELQRHLNHLGFDTGREDGILGAQTADAVIEFQRNIGARADGIVGPDTVQSLERVRSAVDGPSRAVVREAEDVRSAVRSLSGSIVAIDPGHGPDDPGEVGPGGLLEADASMALARELSARLLERGAIPRLMREEGQTPSASERARTANELGATIFVSLHANAGEPEAEGCSCFYFGAGDTYSPAGQRLAELVQEAITTGMGLKDGRTHPLAIAVLRETRMPAVQVEPCFITNAAEERLLADAGDRARLASAIASGIERFFVATADPPSSAALTSPGSDRPTA